jgi:hypothetical protein
VSSAKWIVLAAGVIGIIAFVLPLAYFDHYKVPVPVSALDVVRGVDDSLAELATSTAPAGDKAALDAALTELKLVVLACYAPAALFLVIGAIGAVRRRLGRIAGTVAVLLGGVGLLVWYGLWSGASGSDATPGFGLHLLLVSALCGLTGGMMAAVKPDATSRLTTAD